MRIKRETDYAIRTILYMSQNHKKIYSVKEISQKTLVPKEFLSKIIQKLKKNRILKSIRGIKGGYSLTKKPEEISLLDIILIFEKSLAMNICAVEKKYCNLSNICSVHPVWVEIRKYVEKKLKKENFYKLAKRYKKIL
ncbi:MAG: Rrf2 family transcriptional regulator [candidate division WOR-3 bacterium]